MGLLVESRATKIAAGKLANPPLWLREFFGSLGGTASGVAVDENSALRFIAVFACTNLLADVMASCPLFVLKRLEPRGRERATTHPLYHLLHDQPNPEISSFQWRHTGQMHAGLWGNAYSEIEFNQAGRPMALWPLTPWRVEMKRERGTQALTYKVRLPDGGSQELRPYQVLHIPWVSLNGLTGLSPIGLVREAVGLGLAAEEAAARFFGNDARPGVVLKHPGTLSKEARERLTESWESRHQGLSKKHRTAILEESMDIKEVGIAPDDAKFIEQQQFNTAQIARLYRIPPHMIGDVERSTSWGSGIEQQAIGFTTFTIVPWATRWEQAMTLKLLPESERETFFVKFLLDGLLRGDFKTRHEGYALGIQWGMYSQNEALEKEDMNPIPGGDSHYMPLNMSPIPAAGGAGGRSLERRSADGRRRIAKAFERMFEDAAGRVIRREVADIRRVAESLLRKRSMTNFELFVEDFYRDHEEYLQQQMAPVFSAYAEAVASDAGEEIGVNEGHEAEIGQFMAAYLGVFTVRWIGSSKGQVLSVVRAAVERGADPATALSERFDEWGETRAAKVARRETVQAGSAVALTTWQLAGIQRKTWQASGKSCPYCDSLSGRTVEITKTFVQAGMPLQPDGTDAPLVTHTDIGHPPVHRNCDCTVTPG